MLLADPVHPVLADYVTTIRQLVGEEAVAKGRVVSVQIEQRVGQVGVLPVTLAEWVYLPLVEGLASKAEHRRSAKRGTPRSPALGPGGTSFWEGVLGEAGGGATQDLVLHHETTIVAR